VWEKEPDKRGNLQMFLKGIDYQYCKGCLKCVEACPTEALTDMLEEYQYAETHRVPQQFPYAASRAGRKQV
jgi:pyruvate ferredoxin oxidoreductase gamma subunit